MTPDAVVGEDTYPVLGRVPLERPLRPFRTNRMRARALPRERAHAGVVLDVEGELVAVQPGRPVFRTKGFSRATTAIYVDLSPYDGEVTLPTPSADASQQFGVTVRFRCMVHDPHAVLAMRVANVGETLINWTTTVVRSISPRFALAEERALEQELFRALQQQLTASPPFPAVALHTTLATVWVGSVLDLRPYDRGSATLEVVPLRSSSPASTSDGALEATAS